MPDCAVYALTAQGVKQALRLARAFEVNIFVPQRLDIDEQLQCIDDKSRLITFEHLQEQVAENFNRYSQHIFITAAGIAVRSIAPLLQSKYVDPAVVVLDQDARFVVSLLSGHIGGANALAYKVAEMLGAVPVITTATDSARLPALDVLAVENALHIANPEAVKRVSSALLAGQSVGLYDPDNHLRLKDTDDAAYFKSYECSNLLLQDAQQGFPCVLVSEYALSVPKSTLLLHPKILFAGIGCKRGVNAAYILELLQTVFAGIDTGNVGSALAEKETKFSKHSLMGLVSFKAKEDEPALHEVAAILGLPIVFYSHDVLAAFPVSSVSIKAEETFGLKGVCEPAALAAASGYQDIAGDVLYGAELVAPKSSHKGVTLALAKRCYQEIS